MSKQITYSVVAPAYNEATGIQHFVHSVCKVLRELGQPFEIILVDDGSKDNTWEAIGELSESYPELTALRLSRNFGHQSALLAGLKLSRGEAIISMDADLQHPPDTIPELIAQWHQGHKIVNTTRLDNGENSFVKHQTSKLYYRIFSYLSEVQLQEGSSDFRLLDRQVLDVLLSFQNAEPFIRGAVQFVGYEPISVPYSLAKRHSGTSKFTLKKMLQLAHTGLIAHSTKPLTIGITAGVLTAGFAFAEILYIIIQSLRGNTVPGWASTVGVTSILFAITFLLLGLIGAYLASIHRMLQNRPHYIVTERLDRENTDP